MTEHRLDVTVNGRAVTATVEPRLTLADFLRDRLRLTGTHLGCEHGVCGACTVLADGAAIRSCLVFAIQMQGAAVTTVEGLTPDGGGLSDVQEAFRAEHGLQCGFCTPGFVVSVTAFLDANPEPSAEQIRDGLSGNLCRCTGYQGIVRAVQAVVHARREARDA
jgi:carbon-monoxide dehydrogenase small subunit